MHRLASITFGQVLLKVLEVALLATWLWVAVSVVSDVYRSPDLPSSATAGWILLIILTPLLGVLIYVIARGAGLRRRRWPRNTRSHIRYLARLALTDPLAERRCHG